MVVDDASQNPLFRIHCTHVCNYPRVNFIKQENIK